MLALIVLATIGAFVFRRPAFAPPDAAAARVVDAEPSTIDAAPIVDAHVEMRAWDAALPAGFDPFRDLKAKVETKDDAIMCACDGGYSKDGLLFLTADNSGSNAPVSWWVEDTKTKKVTAHVAQYALADGGDDDMQGYFAAGEKNGAALGAFMKKQGIEECDLDHWHGPPWPFSNIEVVVLPATKGTMKALVRVGARMVGEPTVWLHDFTWRPNTFADVGDNEEIKANTIAGWDHLTIRYAGVSALYDLGFIAMSCGMGFTAETKSFRIPLADVGKQVYADVRARAVARGDTARALALDREMATISLLNPPAQ